MWVSAYFESASVGDEIKNDIGIFQKVSSTHAKPISGYCLAWMKKNKPIFFDKDQRFGIWRI